VDACVAERVLPRLEWIRRAALLFVSHGQRVTEVEDKPVVPT